MRIVLGADHAGFEMKRDLAAYLAKNGHEIMDIGAFTTAPVDYPDIAEGVAQAVRNGQADRGIIVCGSGIGAAIAACKFPGIRAGVCHDTYSAKQAVEHDDMNVLCLGSRVIGAALAHVLAETFLAASFSGEERHMTRLAKIDAIESRYSREE
ncbi:MAG TPA: ribose 5-phosphate isomerase B [Vicinamibacterales bacterium]|jgi:ribose 5-phosphate isomerase B